MRCSSVLPTALIALAIAGVAAFSEDTPKPEPNQVTHPEFDRDWRSHCITLQNADVRVVIDPTYGGRIVEYSLKGTNILYLDSEHPDWIYPEGNLYMGPMGGRFDIGPEETVPRHPALWLGKWSVERHDSYRCRLKSVEDKATGVQLTREFNLDKSSSHLRIKQTSRNISAERKRYSYWARTYVHAGGTCFLPLTPGSRFPNGYLLYTGWPTLQIVTKPQDPAVTVKDGLLIVDKVPRSPKLGMDTYAGWFAYRTKENLMFIRRFPTDRERRYADVTGMTFSLFVAEKLIEVEPIGPEEVIDPGRSASFTEEWWLVPSTLPDDLKSIDLPRLKAFVDQHAPAKD